MAGRGDDSGQEPTLELPSFGLRRKKKRERATPAPPPDAPGEATTPTVDPQRDAGPRPTGKPRAEPGPRSRPEKQPEPQTRPDTHPTQALVSDPAPAPATAEPQRTRRPRRSAPRSTPRAPRLPRLAGPLAAAITGAVVGLLVVALTFATLQGCEAVRGTSSCGGGPGFFLLLAVLVLLTYVGSWLLGAFGLEDPGSTSFLAVGLLAVVAMLFLMEVLMSAWMALVIPLVAASTFVLSHLVTTVVVDDE